MVFHGLRATRIPSERRRRDLHLLGKKRFDRLLELCERNAGVAKQGKLKGKPDAIGIPAAFRPEILVCTGQGDASRHGVGIKRNSEERMALLVG